MEYSLRGWTGSGFKVAGNVYDHKERIRRKIEGRWNKELVLIHPKTGDKEVLWTKNPYPEKEEFMYGMSHFMLQFNYFPKRLHNEIAPTDTRWRPDQRCLENGELKEAAKFKDMLEEKQRAVRRWREHNEIEYKPSYFQEEKNEYDDLTYFRYNYKYWEEEREKKDWSRLPDLYSPNLPPEVEEFDKK